MVPDLKRIVANRIFVDRDDARKLFTTLIERIPPKNAELLIFYGISGQGKSALCTEFSRMISGRFRTRFRDVRLGVVDLKEHQLSDPALVMLWVRDALAFTDSSLRFRASI
jgi:hypothetical protein